MRGGKLIRPLSLGALTLAALAAAGCAGEATRFNNTIAGFNKKLNEAGKRLGEAVKPAVEGGSVNAADVKAAYDKILGAVAEVKKEFAALKIPPGAGAKKMAEAYAKFLKSEEELARDQIAQIVKLAEAPRPNREKILELIQQVKAKELADMEVLLAAQREFARENNIPLRPAQ
jgi:hypothetical protein